MLIICDAAETVNITEVGGGQSVWTEVVKGRFLEGADRDIISCFGSLKSNFP